MQEDGTKVHTKPRVLLMGTHSDKASKEQIAKAEDRFQKAFEELDKSKVVQWASQSQIIIATQSLQAKDDQQIRNVIHRLGTNPLTRREYQVKTPCPWLFLGIILQKPDPPDPVALFGECVHLGQGCGISE